jgi:hypothetical protein
MIGLTRNRQLLVMFVAFALFGLGAVIGTTSSAQPPSTKARPVSDAEAGVILGHAVPTVGYLPLGLHRVNLTANPVDLPQNNVVASYAIDRESLVQVAFFKATRVEPIDPGATNEITIAGVPGRVSTRSINRPDGSWDAVTYTWSRDGVGITLTVHLLQGLTRHDADLIAESIH